MNERLNIRRMLEPEKQEIFFDPDTEITKEDLSKIQQMLDTMREKHDWRQFVYSAKDFRILRPGEKIAFSDEEWEKFKKYLAELQGNDKHLRVYWNMTEPDPDRRVGTFAPSDYRSEDVGRIKASRKFLSWYTLYAAQYRIAHGVKLDIKQHEWQQLHGDLEILRQDKNWANFLERAANMKIMAADEVRLTDKGLEIVMPQKARDEPPQQPQSLEI
jgi:hypothetical protein